MKKFLLLIISVVALAGIVMAAQDSEISRRDVEDAVRLRALLIANASDVETRVASLEGGSTVGTVLPGYLIVGNASSQGVDVAVSGDITMATNGAVAIASGVIVDADVSASAAIAHTKLAAVAPAYLLVGNASSQAVAVAVSGDVAISNAGEVTVQAGVITEGKLSTAVQDKIAYLTVVGADAASAGTGTATIQVKDANGNNLAVNALVRTWVGQADDFGADALTDYSVSTGTSKEEVTANAEYLAITDTNGVAVMAIDAGGADSVWVWAEIGGRIAASGEIVLTAP